MFERLKDRLARLRSLLDDQEGQGMVEYGLILILVAIVVLLILVVTGHQTSNLYSNITNALAR